VNRGFFGGLGLIILGVIVFLVYLSIYVVDETKQALVLRFGQVVDSVTEPGLYYKLPLVDDVLFIEKRIVDLDSPPLEIIASDQKRLVVDAFGRYRITNPLLFYQSVGSLSVAQTRLGTNLDSAIRNVLGDATFEELVRDDRAELMAQITAQVNEFGNTLGLEVVDVKIRSADLPEANSQAIYSRMQTERQREATEIRAQGEEAARRIRAEADRTVTVLVAEANRASERLRGEGDAQRNRIFANAFGRDPEFFTFYRSMQAYREGLQSGDTRLVISPDSEFFRYFNNPGEALAGSIPAAVPVEPSEDVEVEEPALTDSEPQLLEIPEPLPVEPLTTEPAAEALPTEPAAEPAPSEAEAAPSPDDAAGAAPIPSETSTQ